MTLKNSKDGSMRKLKLELKAKEHARTVMHTNNQGDFKVTQALTDHYFTNRPNYVYACGKIKVGINDHYVIYGIRRMKAMY